MFKKHSSRLLWPLLCLLLALPLAASAQTPAPAYEPSIGQEGKDVIWVPTSPELVERMLRMAQVTPKDYVVDLGAGDGRIAIAAAKMGVRAMGIEYNPEMVDFANRAARAAGVTGKAVIVQGDIFEKDFSQATVVTMYLLTALNLKLRPKLLEMKPGTRLVAHQFRMGEWVPDETSYVGGQTAHLWIVPAKVQGNWAITVGNPGTVAKAQAYTVQLEQTFQKIEGNVDVGKATTTLREPRLRGEQIRFAFTDGEGRAREFSGRVSGERMAGEVVTVGGAGGRQRWQAVLNNR